MSKFTNYQLKDSQLKSNEQVIKSFELFYGIGSSRSKYLLGLIGINKLMKNKWLSKYYFGVLSLLVEQVYAVEMRLRFVKQRQLENYLSIRNYKGVRMSLGLPIRGQRTSTNASTSRKFPIKLNG